VKYFSKSDISIFISLYTTTAKLYFPNVTVDLSRDKKDNMFLELADKCSAKYIITGDKDLLCLHEYNSTKIITPA